MKFMKNMLMVCVIMLLFLSCTSTRDITEVKMRVVVPQVIIDSLETNLEKSTHFQKEEVEAIVAKEIVKGDTTKWIEFIPDYELAIKIEELKKEKEALGQKLSKIGKFKFEIKPDTIVQFDTLNRVEIKENIIETPLTSKLGFVLIGLIVGIGLIVVIKLKVL